MPDQHVDTLINNLDTKDPDDNENNDRSSISNSDSEDEAIVYLPEIKPKYSTSIADKELDEISKNFCGIAIDVKTKGPINNEKKYRKHETAPTNGGYLIDNSSEDFDSPTTHLHTEIYNNLNGDYLDNSSEDFDSPTTRLHTEICNNLNGDYLDNSSEDFNSPTTVPFVPESVIDNESVINAIKLILENQENEANTNSNSMLDGFDTDYLLPSTLPTSSDKEFLKEPRELFGLGDRLIVEDSSEISGNETLSDASPYHSTSSSSADDFLPNIIYKFNSEDRDVRDCENVMSTWSDKTGKKLAVWIRVNISDENDLIGQLKQELSQGNVNEDKILNIYAIIHRLMKPKTKKEIINTRSLLRNFYRSTTNLLWLVAQQRHTALFNYFIETVLNLEIKISEINGCNIFLHQLAKCHSLEMVDILTAALAWKSRGSNAAPLFDVTAHDLKGQTLLNTVIKNLSQQKKNPARYHNVKQALLTILNAQSNYYNKWECLQFAKDLELPQEIQNLLANHNNSYYLLYNSSQ